MSTRKGWRARVGWRLRCWADRIDHHGAPRMMGWTFTFEEGEGIRFRQDRRGCPLAYLGMDHYERAHNEADSAMAESARNVQLADATVDLLGVDAAREINERMGLPQAVVDATRDLADAQRALAHHAARVHALETEAREARK